MATEEPHLLHSGITLGQGSCDGELVLGLVCAVGTERHNVLAILQSRLKTSKYDVKEIRISKAVIPEIVPPRPHEGEPSEYERVSFGMQDGDKARLKTKNNAILALGTASVISSLRGKDPAGNGQFAPRRAYLVNSLKHPAEVTTLREIYPLGFYSIGIHADKERRKDFLMDKGMTPTEAQDLIKRDEDEHLDHGQRVTDTFHLSDFFVHLDGNLDRLKNSLWRVLEILFGNPYSTPTFDEYAMFLAFVSSLRSGDMARQVGAVIARNNEVLATGANDCPRSGGGLYWPEYNEKARKVEDEKGGRDYTLGEDTNKTQQGMIIKQILRAMKKQEDFTPDLRDKLEKTLKKSRIKDLTEFGRAVHAEMEALLACARNQVSSRGATLYCTTFPCHNCAKHIIAAGIKRVVYVEPYQKSKAAEFHKDAIAMGFSDDAKRVKFEPFVGVGPRRFLDFFSMQLGAGYSLERKDDETGKTKKWKPETARLRLQMLPGSYLDLEILASNTFSKTTLKPESTGDSTSNGG